MNRPYFKNMLPNFFFFSSNAYASHHQSFHCEGVFTTETQSSQSSEYLLIKNSLLRALRAAAVQTPSPASHGSLTNQII